MSLAESVITTDDERIRVTVWTFRFLGDETGPHVHEFDYVVVPVTGGTFTVTDPGGGSREMTQLAGSPYLGRAGTEHNVANAGGVSTVFVEVELKRQDGDEETPGLDSP
jgi:beta-alanine degradation protein BauB